MIDKFLGVLNYIVSKIETHSIKLTTWCWHLRVDLLNKKRRKKNVK